MSFEDLVLWLITLAAPAQTLFILIYGTRSPWWQSLLGRALFTKALALAMLLDLSLIAHWWPTYPYQKEVSVVILAMVLIGSWLQLAALLKERYLHSSVFTGAPGVRQDRLSADDRRKPVDPVDGSVDK